MTDRLDEMRAMLPPSPEWEAWLTASGEQPPDWETLPVSPGIGPVVPPDGDWEAWRTALRGYMTQWLVGTMPPAPDGMPVAEHETTQHTGATEERITFSFGPGGKARFTLALYRPDGEGPFPVFLTQTNHRDWALIAMRRGYIGATFSGCDHDDDTDTFVEAWPEYDWSRLMRRAWMGSRAVDYLVTRGDVIADQIVLTGHSRNGKLSLFAAAFDERIAAVIASSPGAGGALPLRLQAEPQFGESVEWLTRRFPEWFHPRFRFFTGREDRLPFDLHQVVALTAPRPLLYGSALHDNCEGGWAVQQTLEAALPAWEAHGAVDNLRVQWRTGGHETSPFTIEGYVDWCDSIFGRAETIRPMDWRFPRPVAPAPSGQDGQAALLGSEPPRVSHGNGTYGLEPVAMAAHLGRHAVPDDVEKRQVVIGDYVTLDIWMPAGVPEGATCPIVLWLHPWPSVHGYRAAYSHGEQIYLELARAGYAVACFDTIGTGGRAEEAADFAVRYPEWSILGSQVRDAQTAIDALERLAYVDTASLTVLGYGTGATAAALLAARDSRVRRLAMANPPAPFRTATPEAIETWSRRSMLVPRASNDAPYDITDALAAREGVPTLVVTTELDRGLDASQREALLVSIGPDRLTHRHLPTWNHFGPESKAAVRQWLGEGANTGV